MEGRQRAREGRAAVNAAVGVDGGVFPPVELDGLVEPGLASELSRQEELYDVMLCSSLVLASHGSLVHGGTTPNAD